LEFFLKHPTHIVPLSLCSFSKILILLPHLFFFFLPRFFCTSPTSLRLCSRTRILLFLFSFFSRCLRTSASCSLCSFFFFSQPNTRTPWLAESPLVSSPITTNSPPTIDSPIPQNHSPAPLSSFAQSITFYIDDPFTEHQKPTGKSGLSHGFCPFGFTGSLPAATQSSNLSKSLMGLTVSLLISLSPKSPCFSPGLSPSLWLGRERKSKNRRRKERREEGSGDWERRKKKEGEKEERVY
jgi:hypothetical protein